MFSQQLAKFKNETKIITYLRARVSGVLGALRNLCILRIGRIASGCNDTRIHIESIQYEAFGSVRITNRTIRWTNPIMLEK